MSELLARVLGMHVYSNIFLKLNFKVKSLMLFIRVVRAYCRNVPVPKNKGQNALCSDFLLF